MNCNSNANINISLSLYVVQSVKVDPWALWTRSTISGLNIPKKTNVSCYLA